MLRRSNNSIALMVAFIAGYSLSLVASGQEKPEEAKAPEKYLLDYPQAELFCPPVRTTFVEVTHTFGNYRGRRFRQKPNGGYGLPVVDKLQGQNLIHVGADLGWYRVGEPVFAVANGVVRMSTGPDPKKRKNTKEKKPNRQPNRLWLAWGNLVVIEHRLADKSFVTTVYGHLNAKRLVRAGDVVKAGQQIGTIGRKSLRINGGYNPHLHFGVRKGRKVRPGMQIAETMLNGKRRAVTITTLNESEIEIDLPSIVPDGFMARIGRESFRVTKRDGKYYLPAQCLWHLRARDFQIIGYDLKTDDWPDPVAFLRSHQAHTNPAPFKLLR